MVEVASLTKVIEAPEIPRVLSGSAALGDRYGRRPGGVDSREVALREGDVRAPDDAVETLSKSGLSMDLRSFPYWITRVSGA